jgi:hypothetical protein
MFWKVVEPFRIPFEKQDHVWLKGFTWHWKAIEKSYKIIESYTSCFV